MKDWKVPPTKQSLPTRGLSSSSDFWIEQKTLRDSQLWGNQPNLWTCENKIYDLTDYIDSHPGGKSWLLYTRGQDITEHFITHHLNEDKARSVLQKYQIKDCPSPQIPRYTFEQNGLFRKIKRELLKKHTPEYLQDSSKSKINAFEFVTLWVLSFFLSGYYESYLFAIVCGLLIYPLIGIAHNFVHMRQNKYKWLYMVTGFTHQEWERMHCLSHHSYPNTLLDYEIQAFQPLIYYLSISPQNKLFNAILKQFVFMLAMFLNIILKLTIVPTLRRKQPEWLYLVPLLQIPILTLITGNLQTSLKIFLVIHTVGGYQFLKLASVGHRVGKLWTEGNPEIRDFAQHQIYASTDIETSHTKGFFSYLFYAGFNFHAIHHLFPTIDNYHLPEASKILEEEATKAGVRCNLTKSIWEGLASIQANLMNRQEWSKNG